MKKAILFAVAVVTLFVVFSGIALAASPQDIYNDYAAHGKLTQTYTDADLRAYLADATLDQYGDPAILTALDGIAQNQLSGRGTFPFTGVQVALLAVVAVGLVGGGVGLRRLSRARS
jgi:hypothetical protein